MLSNVLIVVLGFFIWLAWLTSGIQHKIIKGFDLSCLFWSSFCCPQNKCPPLFIPFLGLTFRSVVLFCTVKLLFSPCIFLLFILSHFFEHFFPSAPFLFPPSAPASSEALMIFWERCPLGFICFCSLLYFPWNKTTLTDAKQMNLCCAYYSACIVHISTPQFK